ncbi:MAG: hypothetical protein HYX96_01215 [Chloroflexi bacterium]|nr:hypothetical protein [Chloroflexota bacterium]
MRTLSSTLLAAQKQSSRTPYLKVEAKNRMNGPVRLKWERLYTGAEDDYFHGVTMPGDGSLVRARITPPADANKLYYQRVADPAPGSDFSAWTYAGQYNALAVAAASLGAQVSIFWVKSDRGIRRLKSTDYGATWGAPELIDYTPTTAVGGIGAAYRPGGDLALFYAVGATLYVKKHAGGAWQASSTWDKTTGELSGLDCFYDGDWNTMVTGLDAGGDFKVWSLVYGDGADVPAGSWSALKELASAPAGGDYDFRQPFLDKPDVFRGFFVEKFAGNEPYDRPFWSATAPEARFIDNPWREPVPFDLSSKYGLALAHAGDYCWLTSPRGVWRAGLAEQSLDLSQDVTGLKQELDETTGRLTVELNNDQARYAAPGQGNLETLEIGSQLDFSPGYITTAGGETSAGPSFTIESLQHIRAGGTAKLVLHAYDGWAALRRWQARHQFRWNKGSEEMTVRALLGFVLARCGLKLEVRSESAAAAGLYPDFTISPGDRGHEVVSRLLSFVPDVVFIEGAKAFLVNPQAADASSYSYGGDHQVVEGRYGRSGWELSRVQVEGYDAGAGQAVFKEGFAWSEIDGMAGDRLARLEDRNLGTLEELQQRGDAYLRQAEIESRNGAILAAVNCGQQVYDVIDITDSAAGLAAAKRRVLGITLSYRPERAEYLMSMKLGSA